MLSSKKDKKHHENITKEVQTNHSMEKKNCLNLLKLNSMNQLSFSLCGKEQLRHSAKHLLLSSMQEGQMGLK